MAPASASVATGAILGALIGHALCDGEEVPPPPPPPPPAPAPAAKKKIVLRGVNFDFDKATLQPQASRSSTRLRRSSARRTCRSTFGCRASPTPLARGLQPEAVGSSCGHRQELPGQPGVAASRLTTRASASRTRSRATTRRTAARRTAAWSWFRPTDRGLRAGPQKRAGPSFRFGAGRELRRRTVFAFGISCAERSRTGCAAALDRARCGSAARPSGAPRVPRG